MNWKKFFISGLLGGVIVFVFTMGISMLSQMMFNYNAATLPGMRELSDPIMMLFFLQPFVISFTMAAIYPLMKLEGSWAKKGMNFGFACFLVAGIPSIWVVWSSMNYPMGFTISQIIGGILSYAFGGMAIAKIME